MPAKTKVTVLESLDFLKSTYMKEQKIRIKTRLKFLMILKENPTIKRGDLTKMLHLGATTQLEWTQQYKEFGFEHFTKIHSGGNKKSFISSELHDALEKKVHDSKDPLLGYKDAVEWVKKNFNQDIKYNTLRTYLIRNFKTKKKHPRKSHYKKNEDAIVAFKKNPPEV